MFTRTWSEILAMVQVLTLVEGKAQSFHPHTVKNYVATNGNLLIRRFKVPDWMSCIVACKNEPECFSYNYQYTKKKNPLCELLKCGVDQQKGLEDELLYAYGYVFQQLKQHEKMKRCSTGCWIGWTPFRSHCYKFVGQRKTWEKASQYCIDMGGNLTSIHNEEENEFLVKSMSASLSNLEFWFGLKSTGEYCPDFQTLHYLDGTAVSYRKAFLVYAKSCACPNESNQLCRCVKVSGKNWVFADCCNQLPFVCKL